MLKATAKALIYLGLGLGQFYVFSAGTLVRPTTVSGTVSYREGGALPADATIEVLLVDASNSDDPAPIIAHQSFTANGRQAPFAFSLKYDSAKIKPDARYQVRARILVKGELKYTNTQPYQVITSGHPRTVNIVVEPVSRAVMPGRSASLENTHWTLVELNGSLVDAGSTARETYFELNSQEKRLEGSSGCNRMTGGYAISGDSLQFSKVVMTRMACVKGMEIEAGFSKALSATTKFKLSGSELELSGAEGVLAKFKAGGR